jgi:hypothetical protein
MEKDIQTSPTSGATLLPYVLLFGAIYAGLMIIVGTLAQAVGFNSPALETGIIIATATIVANRYVRKQGCYFHHREIMLLALGAVLIKSVLGMGFMLLLPGMEMGPALLVATGFIGLIHWLVLYAYLRWPAQRLADRWLQAAQPQHPTT